MVYAYFAGAVFYSPHGNSSISGDVVVMYLSVVLLFRDVSVKGNAEIHKS